MELFLVERISKPYLMIPFQLAATATSSFTLGNEEFSQPLQSTEWPAHGHIGDKKRDVTLNPIKAALCASPTSEE